MAKRKSKLSGTESGSRIFSFRLPDQVADEWDDKIARSGMNKSEFFRTAVVLNETTVVGDASGNKKKRAVRVPGNVDPDIKRKNFLLAQVSNNINQIAYRLNSDHAAGLVTPALYAEMMDELLSISGQIMECF